MADQEHRRRELAWAAVRVTFGASLALFHGYGKVFGGKMPEFTKSVAALGFPMPAFFAWSAGLAELVGGALVAVGLFARPAAAFAAFTMVVALYRHRVDPLAKAELAILYLVVMLACVARGAGDYSLDARR
jgi:putative oxidoreductase